MLRSGIDALRSLLEAFRSPEDVETRLRSDIGPLFKGWEFSVYRGVGEGYKDINVIHVEFYSVPEGSGGLAKVRSDHQIKLSVGPPASSTTSKYWKTGDPVPATLEARVVRFEGAPTFRRISGTPEKVVSAVTKWFYTNRDALTGEGNHA